MNIANKASVGHMPEICRWSRAIACAVAIMLLAPAWAQERTVTTLAGPEETPGSFDGAGQLARFNTAASIAVDTAGNTYVADTQNHTIRKITPAGEVTTLAGMAGVHGSADGRGGAARFFLPEGVAVDSAGSVYVADMGNSAIRKISPDGTVVTWAGAAGVVGSADGVGSMARFFGPCGITVDRTGIVYVADTWNGTIRKITSDAMVSTWAGTPGVYGSNDGVGPAASFAMPVDVSVDSAGNNLYVADNRNHNIRRIASDRTVSTFAGVAGSAGYSNGPANQAKFQSPSGVWAPNNFTVFVADTGNSVIRLIAFGNIVSTYAGTTPGDKDGVVTDAQFDGPADLAMDGSGKMYVVESGNNKVRAISPAGVVTSLAGMAQRSGTNDGDAAYARFYDPYGIAVANDGAVVVADTFNYTIRGISPAGVVTTLAGLAGSYGEVDGTGTVARFNGPGGMDFDNDGNLFIADTWNNHIRKMTPAGAVTVYAGTNPPPGGGYEFYNPADLAVDSHTNIYVADTFHHKIQKIAPDKTVTLLAGNGSIGSQDGTGTVAQFNYPLGVAVDSSGTVYVADSYNSAIRKITPAGQVTTLAGSALSTGSVDGVGSAARFNNPRSIVVDSSFNIYVADTGNRTVRKVTQGGAVSTLAGLAGSEGSSNGVGGAARFIRPSGLALDNAGNLYATDVYRIRKLEPALADTATIDQASGRIGLVRQLGVDPKTAVAYEWRQVRKSAASSAALSSTNTDNPTFTPDVADYYTFRLTASGLLGKSISYVTLFANPLPAAVAGDFDGDRMAEPGVYLAEAADWRVRPSALQYAWFDFGNGFLGGATWTALAADFDGDGIADPAAYQALTGNWQVKLTSGNYFPVSMPVFLGGAGWSALAADFDGDGKGDPAVYQSVTGKWKIRLSSANYVSVTLGLVLGGPGWSALAADFDGDGKGDPAVYQAATGNWRIALSSSNYSTVPLNAFLGGPLWTPLAADFDGDGKADPAVYRPDTGDFWVMLTSGNYFLVKLPAFLSY